jgi:hypothetical protein
VLNVFKHFLGKGNKKFDLQGCVCGFRAFVATVVRFRKYHYMQCVAHLNLWQMYSIKSVGSTESIHVVCIRLLHGTYD